jgi:hypothetical protein
MFISIDVGIKNLAYIVYDTNIIEWKVVELCSTNATKANLIHLGKKLYEVLEEIDYDFTHVIIENQIGPNAIRMKSLQGMITMYYIGKGCEITYWNACNKLKPFTTVKLSYAERKKLSVAVTRAIVKEHYSDTLDYFNTHKKKDDLADCFLQLMDYLSKNGLNNIFSNAINLKL